MVINFEYCNQQNILNNIVVDVLLNKIYENN